MATTKCAVYNGTGNSMRLMDSYIWHGQKPSCPRNVGDGEWIRFVHTGSAEGSRAAVVYRIKNFDGKEFDWMFAWDNPPKTCNSTTHAYTEVREVGHFNQETWPAVEHNLIEAGQDGRDIQNRSTGFATINDDASANYVAGIAVHH